MTRDGIDYCAQFLEQFKNKVTDLQTLNAKNFNKLWNDTFKEFQKKYNLNI